MAFNVGQIDISNPSYFLRLMNLKVKKIKTDMLKHKVRSSASNNLQTPKSSAALDGHRPSVAVGAPAPPHSASAVQTKGALPVFSCIPSSTSRKCSVTILITPSASWVVITDSVYLSYDNTNTEMMINRKRFMIHLQKKITLTKFYLLTFFYQMIIQTWMVLQSCSHIQSALMDLQTLSDYNLRPTIFRKIT